MFESEPLKTHNVRQLVEMSTYGGQEDVLNTHVMNETEPRGGGESQFTCP